VTGQRAVLVAPAQEDHPGTMMGFALRARSIAPRRPRLVAGALVLMTFSAAIQSATPAWAGGSGTEPGATVDISETRLAPIPVGNGVPHATATVAATPTTPPLASDYAEVEYLFSGAASTYSGPSTGPAKEASTGNPYVTRVIARYPKDPSAFSGRVFLEPFNTTSGPDRDVIWRLISPLLEANGDAWIGVSVRSTSVGELQRYDPVRYADLSIPVNDLVWDMLRQLGAVVRRGGKQSPLHRLDVEHLYMGGYSQSGVDTATFAQAFHDRTRTADGAPIFDGYLPASHAATMTPLQSGSGLIVKFETGKMQPVRVPVFDFETQNDVQGWAAQVTPTFTYTNRSGASVRRPDRNSATDKYRLFEIAGAPHSSSAQECDGPPSTFPNRFFVRAAAAQLFAWVEKGVVPRKAPRIEMATVGVVSVPKVDEYGNAVGGVRSPFVDVPLTHYEVQSTPGVFCVFAGKETPLPADVLVSRYHDAPSYLREFTKSLDATIDAGALLKRDRAEIVEAQTAKAESLLPHAG
jgi:hypothetical protein